MKKLNTILLLFLFSCTVSQYAQQKKDFDKEKQSLWKYDQNKNLYSTPTTIKNNTQLWDKYKNYLTGKDTIFVLKEFGKPNFINKKQKIYRYFMTNDCNSGFSNNKNPENYNCQLIDFIFDEKYTLKEIKTNLYEAAAEQHFH